MDITNYNYLIFILLIIIIGYYSLKYVFFIIIGVIIGIIITRKFIKTFP
jgi:hypothetical protein